MRQKVTSGKRQEHARGDRKFGEKRKGWRKSLLTDRGDRNSPFHQAGTEGTVYIPTWFTCSQEPPWFTGASKSRKGGLNQWNLILRKQRASRQWDWMRAREQSEPKGTENNISAARRICKVQTLLLRVRLLSLDLTRLFLSTVQCFHIRWAEAATHVQTNCCLSHWFCRTGWCWAPVNISEKIKPATDWK